MSTRERWIVYPLLFLTLGIAMRDKIVPPARLGDLRTQVEAGEVAAPRIRCNEIQVGRVLCNALFVNGPNNRPVIAAAINPKTQAGVIETFAANGAPQVQIVSTESGGMVTTFCQAGKVILAMGQLGQNFGVFAQLPELAEAVSLTLPWRFNAKMAPPRTPAKRPPTGSPSKEPSGKTEKTPAKKAA
jgi:hypothetical protein